MEENKRMKVAMICHFSNAEVREHLLFSKRVLFRLVRRLLRMPAKNGGFADIAPWDSNMISSIKERDDLDLYVISAHGGLLRNPQSFEADGVHYTFVRPEMANFLKVVIQSDKLWRRLNPMTSIIKRRIETIHPDIIVLVGAENCYYSSSVLSIKGYPVYTLCQNVINSPDYSHDGKRNTKNASTELEIINHSRYMGVYSEKHYNLLRELGYNGYIFSFNWPIVSNNGFIPSPCSEKEYDFINFAQHMSEGKGYHDSIKALAIVKQKYPRVRLCLVDGGYDTVREELKRLIAELNLEDNVTFIPFFKERNDLFQFLQKVRFAVLPCKKDFISGTQLQSMKYGLPLVCYKTTGTPLFNKDNPCVLIADMNNIGQLAEKMMLLMSDPELASKLRDNAIEYMTKRRSQSLGNMQRLVDNFHAIIANYTLGESVPEGQLFESLFEVGKG